MPRSQLNLKPEEPHFQELVRSVWHALGSHEPISPDTPFGDIEEMAHTIGQAVAREVCRQAAAEQAASAHQAQPCPDCGRACDGQLATRVLTTRDGPLELPEARHHCPRCRRAFFPQSSAAGTDPPPL